MLAYIEQWYCILERAICEFMGYGGKAEEEMVDNPPLDWQSLPPGGSTPTQQVFLVRWSNRCRGLERVRMRLGIRTR